MGGIALMWRGGCIIRSRFLGKIKEAFDKNPQAAQPAARQFFSSALNKYQASWRKALMQAIELGVPTPAFSTALAFYDGYRTGTAAGESAAGAARFLRRAHLRAGGQAARRVLPHQLDRARRTSFVGDVQRVGKRLQNPTVVADAER